MPTYPLLPFVDRASHPALQVQTEVDRSGQFLQVIFHLTGDLTQVLPSSPSLNPKPQRITGLWETTCFEFFLGQPGDENYWEVNLATTGDWNVFRLDRYRENLQEELRLTALPIELESASDRLTLSTKLDLSNLGISQNQAIEVSVTTVIEARSGDMRSRDISYWAVNHELLGSQSRRTRSGFSFAGKFCDSGVIPNQLVIATRRFGMRCPKPSRHHHPKHPAGTKDAVAQ